MSEEKQEECNTPGTIGWNEIITPDKAGSIEFYSKLMGWSSEDMDMPDGNTYTMFKQGDRMIGGCVTPADDSNVPPMWLSYIIVEDLDTVVEKAKSLGGTICKERVDLPMGSFSIVTDPQGATFAFWQASGECPSGS
jgi:predicted enzyme related to lactoylglutathione lyase